MSRVLSPKSAYEPVKKLGGGKAANLARLTQGGFDVPTWFCVSVLAYDEFIEHNGLQSLVQPAPPFADCARAIEQAFLKAEIPSQLKADLQKQLVDHGLENEFVAVRSSGLDEDSAEHSFAGQFSSYLFQKGWDNIERSLKLCWASGFSERALSYRAERGLSLDGIRVGVVIQRMVDAEAAGVVFSRHPIKVLNREQVLISSVWGLGEGLVSGELDSDNFEVDRSTKVVLKQIADKTHAMRQAPEGGLLKSEIEAENRKAASLTDEQIREVADLSAKLEDQLGAPQDSEWVIERGKLYLVQTRPITNLPPPSVYDENITGKRPTLWDNSNIIESYGGVTSPLTFSFASYAYQQVYLQFCALMGVPKQLIEDKAEMFRNMLGLIRGRIYYNLVNWYQLVLMLPGSSSNKGFMETMMGVKDQIRPELAGVFDFVKEPPKYSLAKKLVLFAKTLWRFVRIDAIVGGFRSHFDEVYDVARKKNFRSMSLSELSTYYQYLLDQFLNRWHAPIINDYLCMLFFGLLKKLTQIWVAEGDEDTGSLQNDLLCGEGGLESTEPTKCLMAIAARIDRGDTGFREWFVTEKASEVWAALARGERSVEVAAAFADFLDRYGFRCVNELKLEEPDLHDDPTFAVQSVAAYVRTGSYEVGKMEEREREIRAKAEEKVRARVKGPKGALFFWVLKHARKAVKNRENLRFARTKVFGISRHLFRAIGSHLAALGQLRTERDVFYLTVEEIMAFIEGRSLVLDLKALVIEREHEFNKFKETPPPPDRFVTYGAVGASTPYPTLLAEADLLRSQTGSTDPNVLTGTPCCPGVVEGVVRVVEKMEDAENLDGQILVSARTDPGWVPLYPSCSGLLIERGSLLSHSAVVARELGLPTIVGVSGLMTKLKTGQRVRLDGGKGEVRIL